jgi:hypothetical protein
LLLNGCGAGQIDWSLTRPRHFLGRYSPECHKERVLQFDTNQLCALQTTMSSTSITFQTAKQQDARKTHCTYPGASDHTRSQCTPRFTGIALIRALRPLLGCTQKRRCPGVVNKDWRRTLQGRVHHFTSLQHSFSWTRAPVAFNAFWGSGSRCNSQGAGHVV